MSTRKVKPTYMKGRTQYKTMNGEPQVKFRPEKENMVQGV